MAKGVPFASSNGQVNSDLPPGFRNPSYNFQTAGQVFNVNLDCNTYCVDAVPPGAVITLLTNQGVSNPTPGRAYKTDGVIKILTISSSQSGMVTLTCGFGLLTMTQSIVSAVLDAIDWITGNLVSLAARNLGFAHGEALIVNPMPINQNVNFSIGGQSQNIYTFASFPIDSTLGKAQIQFNLGSSFTAANVTGSTGVFTVSGVPLNGSLTPLKIYDLDGYLVSKDGVINGARLTPGTAQVLTFFVDMASYYTISVTVGATTGIGFLTLDAGQESSSVELKQFPALTGTVNYSASSLAAGQTLIAAAVPTGREYWVYLADVSLGAADAAWLHDSAGVPFSSQGQNVTSYFSSREQTPIGVSVAGSQFSITVTTGGQAAGIFMRYGIVDV